MRSEDRRSTNVATRRTTTTASDTGRVARARQIAGEGVLKWYRLMFAAVGVSVLAAQGVAATSSTLTLALVVVGGGAFAVYRVVATRPQPTTLLTSAVKALAAAVLLWATGGATSPFVAVLYFSIVAVGLRASTGSTWWIALLYSIAYVAARIGRMNGFGDSKSELALIRAPERANFALRASRYVTF